MKWLATVLEESELVKIEQVLAELDKTTREKVERIGLKTTTELVMVAGYKGLRTRGVGRKTLRQLEDALAKHGLPMFWRIYDPNSIFKT